MSELDEYKELIKLAEQQKEEKSRLKGTLDFIASSFKKKGYKTLLAAENDLKKKKILMNSKIQLRDKKIKDFREKYAEHL